MKIRVVFLFVLLAVANVQGTNATSSRTFAFEDYEIRTTLVNEGGASGYHLVKVGKDPFARTLLYEEASIRIHNIVEIEGNHVLYGYYHKDGEPSYYDGFLTVLSPSGEELAFVRFDYEQEEDVRMVQGFDGGILVVVQVATPNDRGQYDFLRNTIVALDYHYRPIDSIELYQEIQSMATTDRLLLLEYDYDNFYDVAITSTLNTIRPSDPLDIETDEDITERIYIPFVNEATLNDQVVRNGVMIDYPGHYRLIYDGFVYRFTVHPRVEGVVDGGVYNEPLTPIVSTAQLTLNGDPHVSGTVISEPGTYDLTVRGLGGYEWTISFTITSNLSGVRHNGSYTDAVQLSFSGTGYLNNGLIPSPFTVEEPGEYILTIQGVNGYRETHVFTLESPPPDKTLLDFLKQYDLVILGVTVVSGLLVLKKK
jgi:hypothetical protein